MNPSWLLIVLRWCLGLASLTDEGWESIVELFEEWPRSDDEPQWLAMDELPYHGGGVMARRPQTVELPAAAPPESCVEWWSDLDGTMHVRMLLTPAWQRRVSRRVWWLLEEAGGLLMAAFREAGLELKQPPPSRRR